MVALITDSAGKVHAREATAPRLTNTTALSTASSRAANSYDCQSLVSGADHTKRIVCDSEYLNKIYHQYHFPAYREAQAQSTENEFRRLEQQWEDQRDDACDVEACLADRFKERILWHASGRVFPATDYGDFRFRSGYKRLLRASKRNRPELAQDAVDHFLAAAAENDFNGLVWAGLIHSNYPGIDTDLETAAHYLSRAIAYSEEHPSARLMNLTMNEVYYRAAVVYEALAQSGDEYERALRTFQAADNYGDSAERIRQLKQRLYQRTAQADRHIPSDMTAKYANGLAMQIEQGYHPVCPTYAAHIRTVGHSTAPEYVRMMQIEKLFDKAANHCL